MPTASKKRRASPRQATISDQLRRIIEKRRLSPYAVAQLAGVSPSVISRFMNGERGLSLDSLDAVCSALKLELKESRRGRAAKGPGKADPAEPAQDL